MKPLKIIGVILIVAGALALGFGGFSYTRETEKVHIGPIHVVQEEKHDVNVPLWAGLGAVLVGIVLLVLPKK